MKFANQDFIVVASVLLLSALFNRSIMNIMQQYELFATASDSINNIKDVIDKDTWVAYLTSKYFWFPPLATLFIILLLFIILWILVRMDRKPAML